MKVHAIQTGLVRTKTAQLVAPHPGPRGLVGILTDPDWGDWLPTYAWAIEHEEGVIVVDSGQAMYLLEEQAHAIHPFMRWNARFRMTPEDEIGPQLKARGIAPRDVTKVVLTHMHIDHDAGISHFPRSQILVAGGELEKARGVMGRIRGYLPHRWPKDFEPVALGMADGAFGPFAASQRLTRAGDVVVVATPGHTADHVSVIADDGEVSIILAGDTSYTEAAMLAGQIDGISPNAATTAGTLSAIRQFAAERPTIYLPTHDPRSGARLEARQIVPAPVRTAGAA